MTYSRDISGAKCCLEIIVPVKVPLCFNFGLTLKISPSFCSILLKKNVCRDRSTPNAIQNSRLEIWFLYHFHTQSSDRQLT